MSSNFFDRIAPARRKLLLLAIIYLGYISLGLPDKILDASWLPMSRAFDAPLRYGGFIPLTIALCSSVAGVPIRRKHREETS